MNSETKMAENKRKHESEPKDELYSNKSRSRPAVTARFDPTYGQRSAIPLDEEGDKTEDFGDIEYAEEMDALAYLKSVRWVNFNPDGSTITELSLSSRQVTDL